MGIRVEFEGEEALQAALELDAKRWERPSYCELDFLTLLHRTWDNEHGSIMIEHRPEKPSWPLT